MNREILFRGKRIDNGEWIQGSLVTGAFVKSATGQDIPYIFNTDECSNADCFEDFTDDYGYYEVDPETVGQFTGLTDKNGVKIFEGDVLLYKYIYENYRHEKKKCEEHVIVSFGWMWNDNDGKHEQNYLGWSAGEDEPLDSDHDYEVIGNIHDNPELIK